MKLFNHIPPFLSNKYFLAGCAFVTWMLFFDKDDVYTQYERRSQLGKLQESREYYINEIAEQPKISKELASDPAIIEKYAREKYLMKRDNEEIFLIQTPEKN